MSLGIWARRAAVAAACAVATLASASVDFADARPSGEARAVAEWAVRSADHGGRPFAVVDKKAAMLFVFGADARLVGATPVLLGAARGDASAPGIGHIEPARIPPALRTTPAGRFASEPGRNLDGEDVVWFDYDAGLAIHRLRPSPPWQRRAQRMASKDPGEHLVSLGCVVAPVAFYERVVAPTLGARRGILYVLPDTRALADVFPALRED